MTAAVTHQINLALRTAAGHARAAHEAQAQADKTYEMKMKSAGASVYEAWGLAVRAQPEYQGRKIDDKALTRIYESTVARPWWDKHLAAVKVEGKPADREWAKRTLQWHLDPDAARARRAQAVVRSAVHHRKVKEAAARGARTPQAGGAGSWGSGQPTTAEVRKVAKAVEPAVPADADFYAAVVAATDIDRLLERIRKAVRNLQGSQLVEAELLLRAVVESLEEL